MRDHTHRKVKIASLARMKLIGLLIVITRQPLEFESLALQSLEIQLHGTYSEGFIGSSWGRIVCFSCHAYLTL